MDSAIAKRLVFLGCEKSPRCIIETINIPDLKDGEILCKIILAAVCTSDIHTFSGLHCRPAPSPLGHECVAEVVSHKRSGIDLLPGERVVFSIYSSCGKCRRCSHGLPQKCVNLFKYGHEKIPCMSTDLSGCYGSHVILKPGTAVCSIPQELSGDIAAPINCSLATMVSAVSKIQHDTNKVILIQGCGALGTYGCALLSDRGYAKIICTDKLPRRLQFISKFGGCGIPAGEEGESLKSESVDVVIETCGSKDAIDSGLSLLRPGGLYILVGMVDPNSQLNLTANKVIRKCLTLTGIYSYAPEHLEEGVRFITRTAKKYPWADLIGPTFPLKDFERAVSEAALRRFHRVLIDPQQ